MHVMNLENPEFLLIDYISHTNSVGSLEFSLHVRSALSPPPQNSSKISKTNRAPHRNKKRKENLVWVANKTRRR
jgi:hypothetical protein